MTTKQELIAGIRKKEKASQRAAAAMGIILVAGLFGMALVDYARTHGYLNWCGNVNAMTVFGVAWMISLGVVFVGMLALDLKCPGATCPHCKKRFQAISGQITVATGFCGFCGEQVFEQSFKKAE